MQLETEYFSKSQLPRAEKKFSVLESEFNAHHKYRFDYSKAIYRGVDVKMTIICPLHGAFEQTPYSHLKSEFGCRKCSDENKRGSTYDTSEFIKKANLVHSKRYSYSKTNYTLNKIKVIITCPYHGDFEQTPSDHLAGCGCQTCGENRRRAKYFNKPTTLYYVYIENVNLYKIGITTSEDPIKRFSKEKSLGIKLLWSKKYKTGKEAYLEEQKIIKNNSVYLYKGAPFFSKGGESECFIKDILNKGIINESK